MPKIAIDPMQYCEFCKKRMSRKRYNGRMEDLTAFKCRKFCDRMCMAKSMIRLEVTLAGLRSRAKKFRGKKCESCAATEKLQIHHLDGNPANNAWANLMTLCPVCHTKWHWANGKKARKRQGKCSVCELPARKNGLCNTHASRLYRHGDPLAKKIKTKDGWVFRGGR